MSGDNGANYLQADVEAKTDWTNDSSEMKRSGIERAMSTKEQIRMTTYISGGDALRGNTRPHPEHDG